MKLSSKLKILAAIMTVAGVILIILSVTAFKTVECMNCAKGWEGHRDAFGDVINEHPNFGLLIPGIFITFISFAVWGVALRPEITKAGAKLHSETLDVAGENIEEALDKTLDVAEPVTKRVIKTVKEGIKGNTEEELEKAKKMFEEGLITQEEYDALRKKILGL